MNGAPGGNGETWYVRIAAGNVMTVYTINNPDVNYGDPTISEVPIYGSSRLGMYRPNYDIYYGGPEIKDLNDLGPVAYYSNFLRGQKLFELTNHLGNVLATVTDTKIPVTTGNNISYYKANLVNASEYAPFGMTMPGRTYTASTASNYRYGFNGKEQDPNITSQDYDYGMRIYDARTGRFLSIDPITKKYPNLTPYQFASNTPIWAIDQDGLEAYFIHGTASDNSRWINNDDNKQTRENTNQILRITPNKTYNATFEWGGFLGYGNNVFNNKQDRYRAAVKLVNHIMTSASGDEPITLVGHSHGGNVAIQAVPLLRAALDARGGKFRDVKINLITIETPADNHKGSVENPATWQNMINEHIQIYNSDDAVIKTGANIFGNVDGHEWFNKTYDNPKTNNIKVDVHKEFTTKRLQGKSDIEYEDVDGIGAHSFDYPYPEVLKKNIDNGTIPKLK